LSEVAMTGSAVISLPSAAKWRSSNTAWDIIGIQATKDSWVCWATIWCIISRKPENHGRKPPRSPVATKSPTYHQTWPGYVGQKHWPVIIYTLWLCI
jgi:hypothetical protein